jgi:hypothetical protein
MIYQFKCSCGIEQEKEFPIGKRKAVKCDCGQKMESIISLPRFRLPPDASAPNRM